MKRAGSICLKLIEAGMVNKAMFSFAFSVAAIFWAAPRPDVVRALLTVGAVFAGRTAGCLLDNLVDRHFDINNPRTKDRPLADGSLPAGVTRVVIVLLAGVTVVCTWFLDPFYVLLLSIPVAISLVYAYSKRFTWLCHGILGVACAAAPVGAWLVFAEPLEVLPVLVLGGMVTLWTFGYDIMYGIQDYAFDRDAGLHSIPVRFGRERAVYISDALHVLTAGSFFLWGVVAGLGIWYYIGAAVCTAILIAEHVLIRMDEYKKAPLVFSMNQLIGAVMLIFAVLERFC